MTRVQALVAWMVRVTLFLVDFLVLPRMWSMLEAHWIPTPVVVMATKFVIWLRLATGAGALPRPTLEAQSAALQAFLDECSHATIQVDNEVRAQQLWDVPVDFITVSLSRVTPCWWVPSTPLKQTVFGPYCHISAGYWLSEGTTFEESEVAALRLIAQRAQLADGQQVLDLNGAWGALPRFLSYRYPNSHITCVCLARQQAAFVRKYCVERGLQNVTVVDSDLDALQLSDGTYDRIIGVDLLPHVKNVQLLLHRAAGWLTHNGMMFTTTFCHRTLPYHIRGGWIAQHFFANGTMPSADLLLHTQADLQLDHQWNLDGAHAVQTADAWRHRLLRNRRRLLPILQKHCGDRAAVVFGRWRLLFELMHCQYSYANGGEWHLTQVLLSKRV